MSWFLWKCEHSWPSLRVKSKFSSSEIAPIGFPTGESGAAAVLLAGKAGGRSRVGLELGYEVGKERLPLGSPGPPNSGPTEFSGSTQALSPADPLLFCPPLKTPYFESLSFLYKVPWWTKINFSTYISFIPSFIEQILTEVILHARHWAVPW